MTRAFAIAAALLLAATSCRQPAGRPPAPAIDDAKVVDMATHYQQMAESYEATIAVLKTLNDERTAREARPKIVALEEQWGLAFARSARAMQLGKVGEHYDQAEGRWLSALEAMKAERSRIEAASPGAYSILWPEFAEHKKNRRYAPGPWPELP